jgi:hypothetical protein
MFPNSIKSFRSALLGDVAPHPAQIATEVRAQQHRPQILETIRRVYKEAYPRQNYFIGDESLMIDDMQNGQTKNSGVEICKRWITAIGLVFCFSACGDASSPQQAAKPPALEMDIPKPDLDLEKSKETLEKKSVPRVKKSVIRFQPDAAQLQQRLAAEPVTDADSCLKSVTPMEKRRDAVQREGGLWGHMEQAGLQTYSPIGMLVDTKLNKMVFALRHLCRTAKGVPYDDLARFMNERLETKGEATLRAEFKEMGKEPATIERYFEFNKAAKIANARVLDLAAVHRAVVQGELFIAKYEEFAGKLRAKDTATVGDVQALHDALDEFLGKDPLMLLAVREDSMSPTIHKYVLSDG